MKKSSFLRQGRRAEYNDTVQYIEEYILIDEFLRVEPLLVLKGVSETSLLQILEEPECNKSTSPKLVAGRN